MAAICGTLSYTQRWLIDQRWIKLEQEKKMKYALQPIINDLIEFMDAEELDGTEDEFEHWYANAGMSEDRMVYDFVYQLYKVQKS